MKTLIAMVAMVLLSTAAWGCDWCNDPEYQAQKLGITKQEANQRLWDKFKHLPLKGKAPDPTAWKQTESKFGEFPEANLSGKCDVACEKRCTFEGKLNEHCYSACLHRCVNTEPWADSRYRLERNDISNEYRVTQCNKYGNGCTWVPAGGGVTTDYNEALNILENLRRKESENRRLQKIDDAWRPIK